MDLEHITIRTISAQGETFLSYTDLLVFLSDLSTELSQSPETSFRIAAVVYNHLLTTLNGATLVDEKWSQP